MEHYRGGLLNITDLYYKLKITDYKDYGSVYEIIATLWTPRDIQKQSSVHL